MHFGKVSCQNSEKCVAEKIKALRLMGVYFWLIGKQEKAFSWWKKSIKAGESLMARPELARTYFEVGKRLAEENSRVGQINGIGAEKFFLKAKSIFTELNMRHDLTELERISSN